MISEGHVIRHEYPLTPFLRGLVVKRHRCVRFVVFSVCAVSRACECLPLVCDVYVSNVDVCTTQALVFVLCPLLLCDQPPTCRYVGVIMDRCIVMDA